MTKKTIIFIFTGLILVNTAVAQQNTDGAIVTEHFKSTILAENKIGLETNREILIYLPPGYSDSGIDYPVVYYFHNIFNNPRQELVGFGMIDLIEYGVQEGVVEDFILVVPDFSSSTIGSWYENSPTSGKWLDYFLEEIVPFVENKYRILKKPGSRALLGYFVGGRGALKLAMTHPELFGVVYAMHPVATGSGYLPRKNLDVDWQKIHAAQTFKELEGQGRAPIFLSICQAFLPNADRPPFYCDYLFEMEDGKLELNPNHVRKEQKGFHLDESLDAFADNLRNLQALAFDWARFDVTQDHVIANRRFSKLLVELDIPHQGEEYAGDHWSQYHSNNGRIMTRVLPFLNKYLMFE